MMVRGVVLAALCVGLFSAVGASPAKADFSACESAFYAKTPDEQITLYTLCITKGGLPLRDRSGAYNNRASLYMGQGELDKAFADLNKAIEYDESWGVSYLNRGIIHRARHELAEAEADFTAATQHLPNRIWAEAYSARGAVRAARGDFPAALADFDLAIRQDRKNPSGLNSKAWLLATSSEDHVRDGAAAVDLAKRAVALGDTAGARDTLAAAYAEAGRFDEAVAEQRRAMEMLQKRGAASNAGFEARLALYLEKHPYRETAP